MINVCNTDSNSCYISRLFYIVVSLTSLARSTLVTRPSLDYSRLIKSKDVYILLDSINLNFLL
jgi:hypothetical protein